MKKIFAFIVLLSHMNFTMFFPTVEEHDVYTANGIMVDEINSVYEFVNEVLLGDKDDTPEDEDDDQPDYYQVVKIADYYYNCISEQIKLPFVDVYTEVCYPEYNNKQLLLLSYDIVAPPPEA